MAYALLGLVCVIFYYCPDTCEVEAHGSSSIVFVHGRVLSQSGIAVIIRLSFLLHPNAAEGVMCVIFILVLLYAG